MPLCEGLPDKPCPRKATGTLSQGDLMLCSECELTRFPYLKTAKGKGKDAALSATVKTRNSTRTRGPMNNNRDTELATTKNGNNACASHGVCPRCQVPADNKAVVCDICSDPFHALCTGLTTDVFSTLVTIVKDVGWVCTDCRTACSSKMVKIQTSLSRTNEELSVMRTLISNLKSEIDNLKADAKASTRVSSHSMQILSQPESSDEESNETNAASRSKASTQAIEISKVIHDLNRRKCNVIISGLAEPSGRNEVEKRNADLNQFERLCEEHLDVKPAVSHIGCKRLGKLENYGGKPRRLLIYLTSESAATSLLKSARLLRQSDDLDIASNVFINPDLSPAESKLAFEKRQRRRERRDNVGIVVQQKTKADNTTDQQGSSTNVGDGTSTTPAVAAVDLGSTSGDCATLSSATPPLPSTSSSAPSDVQAPFS